MGISIKNEKVEALIREYAEAEGMGVTEAVAHAVRVARQTERHERGEAARKAAIGRFLDIASRGWTSDGAAWTRDELHER